MTRNLIVTGLVATIMAGFILAYVSLTGVRAQIDMGGMPSVGEDAGMGAMVADAPIVPPVKGYAEGEEIRFIHTEASDPQVAQMLTDMMASPVLVVSSLGEAPGAMLASVYVFTNGIRGEGPFGFQPDVFDHPPGSDGYSPLRAVHLVSWRNEGAARELRSVGQVGDAEAAGQLTIQRPGAVVNMPFLTWPGGHR